jgi:hypothetical protein
VRYEQKSVRLALVLWLVARPARGAVRDVPRTRDGPCRIMTVNIECDESRGRFPRSRSICCQTITPISIGATRSLQIMALREAEMTAT